MLLGDGEDKSALDGAGAQQAAQREAQTQPEQGGSIRKPDTDTTWARRSRPPPTPAPCRSASPASPSPRSRPAREMVKQTVREALRDAMAEEMRRDPTSS